jgi:hypothetical protein
LSVTVVLAQTPNPDNTIDCAAFKKQPDGWFVEASATFKFGGTNIKSSSQLIRPNGFEVNGVDLYDAIGVLGRTKPTSKEQAGFDRPKPIADLPAGILSRPKPTYSIVGALPGLLIAGREGGERAEISS